MTEAIVFLCLFVCCFLLLPSLDTALFFFNPEFNILNLKTPGSDLFHLASLLPLFLFFFWQLGDRCVQPQLHCLLIKVSVTDRCGLVAHSLLAGNNAFWCGTDSGYE